METEKENAMQKEKKMQYFDFIQYNECEVYSMQKKKKMTQITFTSTVQLILVNKKKYKIKLGCAVM